MMMVMTVLVMGTRSSTPSGLLLGPASASESLPVSCCVLRTVGCAGLRTVGSSGRPLGENDMKQHRFLGLRPEVLE